MRNSKLIVAIAMAVCMALGFATTAQAGKNADMRVNYVLQNLGVKRDVQANLKPLLVSYLADKKAANKAYDDMKTKLKPSIKNGTLTEKQAQALLTAKWVAAEKELAVKRQYETKFKTVLSAKKTYLCFSLLNDKSSKILGQDGQKDSEE